MEKKWWHQSVVYQIYPRSFQDSNGDGIGDIPGIISRLDYLEQLGIEVIWLSPVYQSPNDDNGYDISDYYAIHPDFGTMEDLEQLIEEAKRRNIRIVMDLVVNHTSDEHPWFVEAKKSKDNPYRDFYIWRDEPNDITSFFSGSAWEYDEQTEQFYFHLFSKKQPDLNWENETVRQEIWKMMNFWLEKGIGGFRMDVIELIGKEPDKGIIGNGPNLHPYLQEMYRETLGNYDILTVGETGGATPEFAKLYTDPERKELSMIFQMEHMGLDQQPNEEKWNLKPLDKVELKQNLSKWQEELSEVGWNSLFWNNHDQPRIVSRWGNDQEYRVESAKMFAILLHLMKGTPYIYQGEEIGMTNYPISDIDEADDIETINMYRERMEQGYAKEDILESINTKGRDNARRPMQWDERSEAGFTTGTPWISVHPNHQEINVKNDLANPDSIFYCYQKLVQLRKENPVLIYGTYQLLREEDPTIFAYLREYEGEKWLVCANFSEETRTLSLAENPTDYEPIVQNYERDSYDLSALELAPYETFAVKIE
ncbi:glycoside hydrolase family 13 protein [Jeotgalibaca caeni]|uniref:glycoside hydrolase family 13 protein n=1 Tax=Jeotgalibaca caeni TaxID=3028623 RepID=UPI00237D5F44|nr:alpha-glucosidase [Jeotgalibaca caeni]MDE1549804.1 alpha-glucosidase [Jeotgalibaca caeni]